MNAYDRLDLNTISYEWVDKTTDPKLLKKALKLLKDDGGYFPDLEKTIDKRLESLDIKYKLKKENQKVNQEDIDKVKEEMLKFEQEYNKKDKIIQDNKLYNTKQPVTNNAIHDKNIFDNNNKNIFSNDINQYKDGPTINNKPNFELIKLERQQESQNQKIKGNELMKTNEYSEAIRYYTQAIDLNSTDPTIFCNRALAYIKETNYSKALNDCNLAIDLKNDYIKAYYRRGIAYVGLKNYKDAIEDFLLVLNDNPNSSDVLNKINEAMSKWKNYDSNDYSTFEKIFNIKINRAKEGKYAGEAKGNVSIGKDGVTKVNIMEGNVDEDKEQKTNQNTNQKENKTEGFKKINIVEEE